MMSKSALQGTADRADLKAVGIEHPGHVQPLDVDARNLLLQETHILGHRIAIGPAGDQRFQRHAAPVIGRDDDFIRAHLLGQLQEIAGTGDNAALGILNQSLVDSAEFAFMHEGQFILQVPALGPQHLQKIEGAAARADHQQMGTKQAIAPEQGKAGSRRGGAAGEATHRHDAEHDRNLQTQDRSGKACTSHRKNGDQGNAAERPFQAAQAFLAVKAQGIEKSELDDGIQQRYSDIGSVHAKADRQRPEHRDRQGVEQEEGKTRGH